MSLNYEKMSLFDAPHGAVIVHACNAQGVWGAGIAKTFVRKYPFAYKEYQKFCEIGYKGFVCKRAQGHFVGCLITSNNYGSKKDTPSQILYNTVLSLEEMYKYLHMSDTIYSNKFNSGLFGVPWERTEEILKVFVEKYSLNWTVAVKGENE